MRPAYRRSHCERDRTLAEGTTAHGRPHVRRCRRDPGCGTARVTIPALALTVIAACQLMVVLDATIVNIALPHIQHSLDFSTTDLSWVVNAYTLTFGGLLLLGGRAGDILGRRRVFIFGVAALHPRLAARRPRPDPGLAARRPRPPGRRRRHRVPDRAGPDHHHLRRRAGAQPGVRGLRRGLRGRRRRDRPARRRHAHVVAATGAGCCSSTCPSAPADRAGHAPLHHGVRAPPGPLRPGRRAHLHRRACGRWSTASSAPPQDGWRDRLTLGVVRRRRRSCWRRSS